MTKKLHKERYIRSADNKHLYCYTNIWGDSSNILCVLQHHPRKRGFDPQWNMWYQLAKRLGYKGIRIIFCYTEKPKPHAPLIRNSEYPYDGKNNAKSTVIRNKALLSSISLVMTTQLYESNNEIMLGIYQKAKKNYLGVFSADEYMVTLDNKQINQKFYPIRTLYLTLPI